MSQRFFIMLALLTLVSPVLGQETAEEQAQRLLENGRSYREQGKLEAGARELQHHHHELLRNRRRGSGPVWRSGAIGWRWMETTAGPATPSSRSRETTRRATRRLGPTHYLGLLTLRKATTPAQLDDALAQFTRVATLYPRSDWVPRSLQASATVHRRAGRFEDAVAFNRRVALEYPASDAAPRAQFEAGHALALLGQPRLAMEEFQGVRNRFPQSPWAATALERTTALYRLYGRDKPDLRGRLQLLGRRWETS